jgi:hypothetical protein
MAFIELNVVKLRLVEHTAGVVIAIRIFISDALYLWRTTHWVRIRSHRCTHWLRTLAHWLTRKTILHSKCSHLLTWRLSEAWLVRCAACSWVSIVHARLVVEAIALDSLIIGVIVRVVVMRWREVLAGQKKHLFMKPTDYWYFRLLLFVCIRLRHLRLTLITLCLTSALAIL